MTEPDTGRPRVGFLGLGIMGSRMAANLAAAGHPLTVWTHTPGKAAAWAAEHPGTTPVSTPAEVGAAGDVVITMLVDGDQVARTLTGPDGVASRAAEGLLCVDMSTIGPQAAREVGAELATRGVHFVDAPVTGSSPAAEAATLTIMAGGADDDVARARPLLETMGRLVLHVGPLGQGQMLKVINNSVAAANAATLAQALIAAEATGVDLDALCQVMSAGSGASTMLTLKGRPMIEHDYTTLFKLDHMRKDLALCLHETDAAGVPFPSAALAAEAMATASDAGFGDVDFASVVETYEGLSGRRLQTG
jgi:3-hydroxyisobutyrate dehydrogenase-like beta-hydroxyacid dehydrogenase